MTMRWTRWRRWTDSNDICRPERKARWWLRSRKGQYVRAVAPPKQIEYWLKASRLRRHLNMSNNTFIGRSRLWRIGFDGYAWTLTAGKRYADFDRWANSVVVTEHIPDNHEAFVELVQSMSRYATALEMVND